MICRFAYVDYPITNGSIKSINIAMVKPHIVKIKDINYLIFDESDDIFINGYEKKIKFKDFKELEDKLKTSNPTTSGKEVKIDKDTYDTLNHFMNTSKQVLKEMPNNQALFKELTDYTKSYKDLENEKRNIQVEVRKLEYQNEKLQQENNRLHNFLHSILQTLKKFFHRLLKIGTEKDKDDVVSEIKEYYNQELYDNFDLHEIANNTSKEQEINDYLYTKNYEYDDKDFDI